MLDILNTSKTKIIIIDNKTLYHCGASFKDLGKKCFAITKIDDDNMLNTLLKKLYIIILFNYNFCLYQKYFDFYIYL